MEASKPVSGDSSEDSDDSDCHKHANSLTSIMLPEQDYGKSKAFFPTSFEDTCVLGIQEHARPRTINSNMNNYSLTTSIERFRTEFDDMKEKMTIFGESLGLCKCIALDFNSRVSQLEKRLTSLEKKQCSKLSQSHSNYSYIIKKNKHLSQKTLNDARVSYFSISTIFYGIYISLLYQHLTSHNRDVS